MSGLSITEKYLLKKRLQRFVSSSFLYIAVALIVLWVLAPYTWLVISSFSSKIDLLEVPLKIPTKFTLDHYHSIFSAGTAIGEGMSFFTQSLMNSVIITFGSTVLSMVLGVLSAYAISRLRFKGRNQALLIMMISYMLPPIAIVIPGYMILKALSLYDSRFGLILVNISFILPLIVWIMRGFFMSISKEMEESARIDGCSYLGSLFRIVLPLSAPGIVSAGIFAFIASWNEYLYAFLYTSMRARTLPVLLGEFTTKVGIDYLNMAAAGVITSLPPVILALVFQKFLISGLTEGSVKG
ncbi:MULTISPECIES: carbohydrate ABC transporter permease [unclassified Oceanispirochaeta]|uniref:carbohydrate ABC transporter permease n=1 Tax=unclassified Oceanispirochaeta TaxID=2635722 RepID=UPI000E095CF5|nr:MULTISPECIES: carbohydrate ABC transporter permease [unclassified Oceanispirochaeta]MBF9014630.1 carbohydrate ABC transporter permease [Oceanispirochaeta sp. M2]NPD70886.1 carbohydrate ABC transporter permease [Oceanispirochaeta sp. M1]RDG34166.1 carbohydrate ABC transporter permease [Oceanispirochaeta sp. M1]